MNAVLKTMIGSMKNGKTLTKAAARLSIYISNHRRLVRLAYFPHLGYLATWLPLAGQRRRLSRHECVPACIAKACEYCVSGWKQKINTHAPNVTKAMIHSIHLQLRVLRAVCGLALANLDKFPRKSA